MFACGIVKETYNAFLLKMINIIEEGGAFGEGHRKKHAI
jgi:hypothetical protein